MFYKITIKDCAFFGRHGVLDQEEVLGQRFFVDAELDVEAGDVLETDNITNTVDYGVAFAVIETIVTGKRRYLIEVLANDVVLALFERFPQIHSVRITIRKPSAPVQGILDYVEVSVERNRNDVPRGRVAAQ